LIYPGRGVSLEGMTVPLWLLVWIGVAFIVHVVRKTNAES
jgi:hypothetical protein